MIFRYGVAKGYCSRDVTQDYKGMLKTKKSKHMPTLTDHSEISELLQDIESYQGTHKVKYALQISAYIFVRPIDLVNSKWEYIDFENSQWIIPAKYMKMKRDHLIPITKQVKTLLELLLPIISNSAYIFPSDKNTDKSMHSETVNKAIRRIDNGKYVGRMVLHGFRVWHQLFLMKTNLELMSLKNSLLIKNVTKCVMLIIMLSTWRNARK
ncbi:hypothetical protein [uncultured Gammaproteobacteria bacterium]|nr:hypothetical protein [uncultured Gammaproteobacteria bacterium]CAC9620277.1 hypothetical protein [uncultured Gammaproteobacteria bacterium]